MTAVYWLGGAERRTLGGSTRRIAGRRRRDGHTERLSRQQTRRDAPSSRVALQHNASGRRQQLRRSEPPGGTRALPPRHGPAALILGLRSGLAGAATLARGLPCSPDRRMAARHDSQGMVLLDCRRAALGARLPHWEERVLLLPRSTLTGQPRVPTRRLPPSWALPKSLIALLLWEPGLRCGAAARARRLMA